MNDVKTQAIRDIAIAKEQGFRDGYLHHVAASGYPSGRLKDAYLIGHELGTKEREKERGGQ